MKILCHLLLLPLCLLVSLALLAFIPREEWRKLNDSLPPP